MKNSADPQQCLVPAGNGDKQNGEQVPERPVPAEVAALWAELRYLVRQEAEHWCNGRIVTSLAYSLVAVLVARLISKRSRADTGGNDELSDCGRKL